jgi:hypothetical protein
LLVRALSQLKGAGPAGLTVTALGSSLGATTARTARSAVKRLEASGLALERLASGRVRLAGSVGVKRTRPEDKD